MRDKLGRFIKGSVPIAGYKKGSIPWNKGMLVKLKCIVCNKVFYVNPYRKNIAKCCSYKCLGINNWKGKHHSEETKRKMRESHKGEKNPLWKGGKTKTSDGYVMIKKHDHPFSDNKNYVKRSRLVVEKHINRFLKPEEIVHHINGIVDDDRLENLKLFENHSEHMKFHYPKGVQFHKN
ncbi:MAG: hypothetical protein KAV18_06275 [Candidatus Omnitrophica bacterium]|nr:hypothetical protein [Candidatus Omnitrophota bacterium]